VKVCARKSAPAGSLWARQGCPEVDSVESESRWAQNAPSHPQLRASHAIFTRPGPQPAVRGIAAQCLQLGRSRLSADVAGTTGPPLPEGRLERLRCLVLASGDEHEASLAGDSGGVEAFPYAGRVFPRGTIQRSLLTSDDARAAIMAASWRKCELGFPGSRRKGLGRLAAIIAACSSDSDEPDLLKARRAAASAPNSPPGPHSTTLR
jgi:hypothetical protein